MKASLERRDYRKYVWRRHECLWMLAQTVFVVFFLAYFFYRSIWAIFPLSLVGIAYLRLLQKQRQEKCRWELLIQFKECMLSVSTSLKAGYAVENAFAESCKDMKVLYGVQSLIYQETEMIRRGLMINITLEELLTDLAQRSDCEEINQFAQIFSIAKRSGGDLSGIIHFSTELIGQKIEVRREIRTVLSGRRLEQTVMKIMPFGILMYIGITYPGYFDGLYHNWQGIVIMTCCLLVYLVAYVLGDKLLQDIEKNC